MYTFQEFSLLLEERDMSDQDFFDKLVADAERAGQEPELLTYNWVMMNRKRGMSASELLEKHRKLVSFYKKVCKGVGRKLDFSVVSSRFGKDVDEVVSDLK